MSSKQFSPFKDIFRNLSEYREVIAKDSRIIKHAGLQIWICYWLRELLTDRIHLSNNKFINGILGGTIDLAGLQCANTSFIFQLDFKANNKGNLLPYNGPLNGSFEVSLNEGLFFYSTLSYSRL